MTSSLMILSTIACFFALVSANDVNYLKFDAKKLKGSWAQNAEIEKYPIYAYYKNNLNESSDINGTVAGIFNDKIYYAVDLAIGSNAQNISVLVDTVSSDLWINSIDNSVCANGTKEIENEDDSDDVDEIDVPPSNNFTVKYTHTKPQLTSITSSSSSSASSSSQGPRISTYYSSYYNSADDVYYVDEHVSTETITTSVETTTFRSTNSYDIQFYPLQSASASTNWLSSYPHPTFPIENLEILNYESQSCSNWGLFNSSNSESFIDLDEPFESLDYDEYQVNGTWAKDFVAYGDSLISNLTFGLVTESDDDSFGVLGLGLKNAESTWLSNGSTYDNFLYQLKSQGFINKTVYSIYDNYLSNGSSVLFGGVDLEQFIGNLSVLPLVEIPIAYNDTRNASAIAITLSSIYFEETNEDDDETSSLIASGLSAAIIDTASSVGSLPYYIYDDIVAKAGFVYSESLEAFVGNETKLVNHSIVFNFQGVNVSVPLLDLTFPLVNLDNEEVSDLVVLGLDATPDTFTLGDSILQYLYISIDLEDNEVAIAPKNFEPASEDIVAVVSSFPNATSVASYNYTYGYNDVTELKLATVNNPNDITKTSFSLSYAPSVTPYSKTLSSAH